jgi:membrane peptidoglycan carboxypeptidase
MIALLTGLIGLGLILIVVLLGAFMVIYNHYASQLPPAEDIIAAEEEAFLTTVLYDRSGQTVIYEVIDPLGGDRRWIGINDIPPYFLDATVAIEDDSFRKNPGFDLEGMARALWSNVTGGHLQGGSTITQQLVKNILLDPEERDDVTLDRKVKEVILATEISRLYSKDQILEWYVNTNFYGNLAYGVEAAAQQYFSKPARDLSLAEAAMLAAIPQYPLQNPIDNPDVAKIRQKLVLDAMAAQGYITRADADAAFDEALIVRPLADRYDITAPHFSIFARAETEAILNDLGLDGARLVTRGGLRVYTTLDIDLQLQAECVAKSQVARLDGADPLLTMNTSAGTPCTAAGYLPQLEPEMIGRDREVTNAAVVMLRGTTGEVLAMVGSVDFWNEGIDGNYNAALLAQRQPASAFKPIVYAAAFLQGPLPGQPNGITAATMLYDVPIEFNNGGQPYTPVNIDRQYHGPMSVRDALANSYNVPPVQLVNMIGLGPVVRVAHRLGINSLNNVDQYGLALALGSGEVSLMDLTYAYNVFNTNGYMIGMPVHKNESTPGFRALNPTVILRIEDADGNVLWEYGQETNTFTRRLILEPAVSYIITDILADREAREPAFGRGSAMELSRPAAVKTGTSNDNRDSWAVGYTPQIVTGVWVGNTNNHSMIDVTGSSGAAPIWHALMEYIHTRDSLPVEEWPRPDTVVEQAVCQISGLLPTRHCLQTRELFYVSSTTGIDTRPVQSDTYWNTYSINVCTGRLATASSPPNCVEESPFFDYPPETRAWAIETGQRLPPTEHDVTDSGSPFSSVAIISPSYLARVRGEVEIRGNADDENFAYYRLDYGAGTQPDVWLQIGEHSTEPGRDLVMGTWDTTSLNDGAVYTLRLTMVRSDNSLETYPVLVTVDNQPPTIQLTEPALNGSYSAGRDVYIPLTAEAEDNVQLSHVEFYWNENLLSTSDQWPYSARWEITGTGEQTFWAVVYDKAGNQAESEHVTITVSP